MSHTPGNGTVPLDGETKNRLAASSEQVGSKHGGYRPGAGRKAPGGAKSGPNQAGVAKPAAPAPADDQVVATPADIEFVAETLQAGFCILDDLITGKISRAMDIIAGGDKGVLDKKADLVATVKITPKELDMVKRTGAALASKYAVLSRFAPECALAGFTVAYGMRVTTTLREVSKLATIVANIRAKAQGAESASKTQAD